MPARMKDIADDLGLSVVTVSKVIRDHPDISAETRERVLKRMKELRFQPNLTARALVTGRTNCVGLVVPDLTHSFFGEVAKGLSACLRRKRYGLLISSSEEDIELERAEIDQMLARRVDGLIVASAQRGVRGFRPAQDTVTPFILIDRQFTGLTANFVGIDDERAGLLATEHLISAGCRHIAHVRGPELSTAAGRMTGYKQALLRHSLDMPAAYVVWEETGDEAGDISGYKAMEKLLSLNPRPDGVFCFNDPAAMGAINAIVNAGLRVAEDIAVIGCGNVLHSRYSRVPLSTIDQQSAEIGRRAGELALSVIEAKGKQEPQIILLEPHLIARASTDRKL